MLLAETVFGLLGMALFTAMIIYTLAILRNIWSDEQLSLTKLFIKPEGEKSFKVLVTSALIFSIGMVISAVAMLLEIPALTDLSKVSSLVLFSGSVYFFYHVAQITGREERS